MQKRKTNKNRKKTKFLKYIVWTLSIIALILSSVLIGYYFGFNNAHSNDEKKEKKKVEKRVLIIEKIKKSLKKESQKSVQKRLQEVLKKESKTVYLSSSHEIDKTLKKPPEAHKRKVKLSPLKPKLAIIIDDVSTASQVKAINNLHLVLTKSFLPPSKFRPNTPKLVLKEHFYMVHLPMEAQSFSAEEPFTLRVSDSQTTISQRIKNIKKLFPKVKYINNHTGSKFTADENAMNKLIYALNENKINFLDSRTTAKTKVPKVMKNFGLKYISRDVFLDHEMDKPYVKSQIKKAIKFAKIHGSAVAIGHPHPNTLQALKESKELLSNVDLVYIYKVY